MQQIKVPFLKPTEIDHVVRELLRAYGAWRKAPAEPPSDVDEIVEGYLGLTLELDDLRTRLGMPDVLGATWFEDALVRIDQSLEEKVGRFSFTVAHEIGHWQLHRPLFEMEKVTLSLFPSRDGATATPAMVCRSREKKAPAEWQVDQFAARLLMPAGAMRSASHGVFGEDRPVIEGLETSRSAGELPSELRSLADDVIVGGGFSNVSNEAMCYRLLDLKLVEDAEASRSRLF